MKIGDWYKFHMDKEEDQYVMNKYYSPFKVLYIDKNGVCICKGHHSNYTWKWNQYYIKNNCTKMTKGQVFEELL